MLQSRWSQGRHPSECFRLGYLLAYTDDGYVQKWKPQWGGGVPSKLPFGRRNHGRFFRRRFLRGRKPPKTCLVVDEEFVHWEIVNESAKLSFVERWVGQLFRFYSIRNGIHSERRSDTFSYDESDLILLIFLYPHWTTIGEGLNWSSNSCYFTVINIPLDFSDAGDGSGNSNYGFITKSLWYIN